MKSRTTTPLILSALFVYATFFGFISLVRQAGGADLIENFAAGDFPVGLAFDGTDLWVANFSTNGTATKLRASDGLILDTVTLGNYPLWATYDGENVWVTIRGDDVVAKVRASDDTVLGTFPVGHSPQHVLFDGTNI